jgi:preprotein translocase subunit SecB
MKLFLKEIFYPEKDNFALVTLKTTIFENAEENNCPFTMMVVISGIFEFTNKESIRNELLEQNAIAILFPYVRAIVSTYIANANIPPLILPTVNVVKMMEDDKNKQTDS